MKEVFDKKRVSAFAKWLEAAGAELLPETNEWEVLRYRIGGVNGVLYKNSRGAMTFNQFETKKAWECFRDGKPWDLKVKFRRKVQGSKRKAQLLQRDGDRCFYCGKPLGDDITVEHLIPLNRGGSNQLGNVVLTHSECNEKAGHRTLVEKIALRDEMRA